jgi:DNA invertase Pin-like site-specific DNA recombinase
MSMKPRRVALYARVSTGDQTVENQLPPLRAWAKAAGHEVVGEFVDEGISGAKGKDKRPGLASVMKLVGQRKVDLVAVVALDRLGRSMPHLVRLGEEMRDVGVDLFVQRMGLDTTTPAGQLMFNLLGAFAEFERALLIERTHAGLQRARRMGKRLGRPGMSPYVERRLRELLTAGTGVAEAARMTGVCRMTSRKIKKQMQTVAAP